MRTEFLVRLAVIAGILNISVTSTLLVGRPDLAVRESSEKVFLVAMDLEKQGKFEEAADLYRRIFYDMSATLIAPRAGARLADVYRRRLLRLDDARAVLTEVAAIKGSAYAEEAQKDLDFMNRHWGQDGSALKLYYEASKAFRSGDSNRALELFDQIIREHADSTLKPEAMLRKAVLLKKLNRTGEAAQLLRDCLALNPEDKIKEEARGLLRGLR